MPVLPDQTLDALRSLAAAATAQAYVPYSGRAEAAVLLLSDGAWVPGVRVESASFSLVIPPLVSAFATLAAAGRHDVVAAALSRPFSDAERAYVAASPFGSFAPAAADVYALEDDVREGHAREGAGAWPAPRDRLSPFLDEAVPQIAEAGIALARQVAERAVVPASRFPVGCVLETEGGLLVPGVNVEHPDWSRILCAERGALGTAVTYGMTDVRSLFLSCLHDPQGTPCGACRQLLVELTPEAVLWMDRGSAPPERVDVAGLLPGSFTGNALARTLASRA